MISVAIDGPAGAGKSTLARAAAEKLGFIYVDTGALYRTVGLKFLNCGFDSELNCDIDSILKDTNINIKFVDGEQRVFLDGEDITESIRTPQASMMASAVSARPQVRAFLLDMQRNLAKDNNVIMDGRDIGTVVLPDATVKIFLTASPKVRAERRFNELKEKGMGVSYDDIYNDMVKRDYNDSHREIAPLKPASDATVADTSELDFNGSLAMILDIISKGIQI